MEDFHRKGTKKNASLYMHTDRNTLRGKRPGSTPGSLITVNIFAFCSGHPTKQHRTCWSNMVAVLRNLSPDCATPENNLALPNFLPSLGILKPQKMCPRGGGGHIGIAGADLTIFAGCWMELILHSAPTWHPSTQTGESRGGGGSHLGCRSQS